MSCADGLILLNKPAGTTSFTALNGVKRILNTKKVGHTGTLDKFAEGLLVVLTGRFTRLAPYITDLDKTYYAVFEFGRETTTLDPEGEVVKTGPVPDDKVLAEKRSLFTGRIVQKPPAFSAVHVAGERAYARALRGENVELPAREVIIHDFNLLEWDPPRLSVHVRCGKGTYIRSLARDFGEACGSCASVVSLRRTEVGPFRLDDAAAPCDLVPGEAFRRGLSALRTMFDGRILSVREPSLRDISLGKEINAAFFRDPPREHGSYLVFSEEEVLVAFISYGEDGFSYRFVAA